VGGDGRPLRSGTCQSVRMSFLALVPGVHTIGALMLTDTETQHALTLRYSITWLAFVKIFIDVFNLSFRISMDVVVHEVQPSN
jgi:hypothetical protein